jgi:hypothetical protein
MSSRIRPAFYRVSQFLAAVKTCLPVWVRGGRDRLTTEDGTLVRSSLTTLPQQQLFARMSPNDRRHALAVVYTLRQAGHHNPALVQAALLHDVGKSAGQPLIHRVLIVLLEAFWPAALQRLSKPTAAASERMIEDDHYVGDVSLERVSWWRRPFVIHARHAFIGAAWAAEAGCEPLVVELIARHQQPAGQEPVDSKERLLAILQWADNLN